MRLIISLLCLLLLGAKHPSTCRIVVPNGGGSSSVGTAAKCAEDANHDYVITAAHVVTDRGRLFKNVRLQYRGLQISGVVHGHDKTADVAVIRTAKTRVPYKPLAKINGREFWAEGMVSGTRRVRYVGGKFYSRDGKVTFTEFSGVPRQGDSGGPIRDKQGRIVAVLWGGGMAAQTMATSATVIYQRIPTPLRNILRIATFHRPVGVYRPAVVSASPGTTVFAPGQIRCAPGGCPPNQLAFNVPGVRPIIEEPRPQPVEPPYVEPQPGEPPYVEPQPGPQGPPGPRGPQGQQGPAGEPGSDATVDYQRIIDGVVNQLPQPTAVNSSSCRACY